MAQNLKIPHNADKMLFAEDFMKFMTIHENLGNYECKYEVYRQCVRNTFNDSVQNAAQLLLAEWRRSLVTGAPNIPRIGELTTDSYIDFTNEMTSLYFPNGYIVHGFLTFCVHVTCMATFFYSRGVTQAPILAVQCIYNILKDFNMTASRWDILQMVAKMIVDKD